MNIREELLKKSWEELYEILGDSYGLKSELVDDILDRDDGSVQEMLESEGSFLNMMTKSGFFEGLKHSRK